MNEFDESGELSEEEENIEQETNSWGINFIKEKTFWEKNLLDR